jgi:hypothetical protein
MLAGVRRSFAPPVAQADSVSRRAVLGASAALMAGILAACSSDPQPGPTDSQTAAPDVDDQVRASVLEDEATLITLYDAVIAAHPSLAEGLTPLREQHVAHAAAMSGASLPPEAAPVVGSQPQALAALIEAEKQAIGQRTAACEAAAGEDLARTLALIAASEAGHAEFLRGVT